MGTALTTATTNTGLARKLPSPVELHSFSTRLKDAFKNFRPDLVRAAYTPGNSNKDSSSNNNGFRRKLQTCAAGSGVTVTSSLFPLMEGCLVEDDIFVGGEIEYDGDTGLILAMLDGEEADAKVFVFCWCLLCVSVCCWCFCHTS